MFTDEQINSLKQDLETARIKTRTKGNVNLSYIEGFDVLDSANSIFGYGNWCYKISKLEQVSQEYNHNENVVICYKAIVEVKVFNYSHDKYITREDVGYGTGIAKSLADANENASKEAVTDAIKRAYRSFGNQFGNSLYDKSKLHFRQDESVNIPRTTQYTNQMQQQTQRVQQQPPQNQTPNYNTSTNIAQSGEYDSLYKIGLDVVENSGYLIVRGDDIFAKKDSIKACGFRWDGKSKSWYKQIEQIEKGAA